MCGEVEIYNLPQRKKQVLVFFDSGSQHSYIDQDLAKRPGLIVSKQKELLVFTFGATRPKKMPYYETEGTLTLENGESSRAVMTYTNLDVNHFWELDLIGIRDNESKTEDQQVVRVS